MQHRVTDQHERLPCDWASSMTFIEVHASLQPRRLFLHVMALDDMWHDVAHLFFICVSALDADACSCHRRRWPYGWGRCGRYCRCMQYQKTDVNGICGRCIDHMLVHAMLKRGPKGAIASPPLRMNATGNATVVPHDTASGTAKDDAHGACRPCNPTESGMAGAKQQLIYLGCAACCCVKMHDGFFSVKH